MARTGRLRLTAYALESRRLCWIATLLAIGMAEVFFFSGYQNLVYDAEEYYQLSQNLSQNPRWLGAANESHTYGYPLFVAICSGFQKLEPKTVRFLVFHGQLLVLLVACAAAARRLGGAFAPSSFGSALYAAAVLNPFLLIHATETLTDTLSAALVFLVVALSATRARHPALPDAIAAFFCASFAVMVRPTNLAVLFAVTLIWAARRLFWRDLGLRAVPIVMIAALLPFLPQLFINARAYGRVEPLVVRHLYRQQARWGTAYLKYGTWIHSGDQPLLIYANPLWRGESGPLEFLGQRPAAYVATLGLHLFAMADHDLPFTYITVARPWYRWPLSSVNYLFLFLCMTGIVLAIGRFARTGIRDPASFVCAALLLAAASSVTPYLPTAVENRFFLPADLLLTPFFVLALFWTGGLARARRWMTLSALGASATVFVALCAVLSAWIAAQAPRLAG